ncbi:MAG: DNA methylase [Desulfobulbaceae bacterium]|nr:DNA methylase [Desulfobulbaceae bacterium]
MTERRLTELENIIAANQRKFYQIGKALKQIRDERLFRDLLFDSFDAYVKDRWDMARSHAYRLIEASNIIENLSPIGDGILPENESQARVLAHLNKDDQRKIWREFISSGITMNAANIRKFANSRTKKSMPVKQSKSNLIDIISVGYKKAVMAMLGQIQLAQNNDWENTSRQAALFWLNVMKEKIISNLRHENRKG